MLTRNSCIFTTAASLKNLMKRQQRQYLLKIIFEDAILSKVAVIVDLLTVSKSKFQVSTRKSNARHLH